MEWSKAEWSVKIGILFSGALLLFNSLPHSVIAEESFKSPFVAVFVDDATEKELGAFPYDRSKYAKAISILRKAKAKAVVIKYFLDQPKPGTGDDELSTEIKKMPVLLQARLDSNEHHSNPFSARFNCASRVKGDTHALLSGQSGWIPLEKFSRVCVGIGFVDIASKKDNLNIPMVLKYKDTLQPSLELAALELVFGKSAQIVLGEKVTLAGHSLPVDSAGQIRAQLPVKDRIDHVSFIDIIKGNFDKKRIAGKIVVLGFDAKETPVLTTPLGTLRIHRLFYLSLESLYQQLLEH